MKWNENCCPWIDFSPLLIYYNSERFFLLFLFKNIIFGALRERERRVEKILTYSSEMLKRAHQIDNVNLWDLLRVVCSLFWLPLSLSLANSGSNRYYRNIQNCLNDKQTSNSQVKRDGKVYTAKRGFCVGNLLQTFCRAIENFMLMSLALSPPPSFTSRRSHKSLVKWLSWKFSRCKY